jgi:hypothetical protein
MSVPRDLRAALISTAVRLPPVRRRIALAVEDRPYNLLRSHGQVRPLSRRELRSVDDYARDVLGDLRHRGDLRFFAAVQGRFVEGWIPESYLNDVVLPQISGKGRSHLGSRLLTARLFDTDAVPDVGHLIGGQWVDQRLRPSSREDVGQRAFLHGPLIVAKVDGSLQGRGVEVLDREEFMSRTFPRTVRVTFQRFVRAHPELDVFGTAATATVRLTTGLLNGHAELCAARLRVGRASDRVVRSSSQLSAPIDSGGRTGKVAMDPEYRCWERHPDAATRFEEVLVPRFADAVTTCTSAHERLPQIGLVGWDVTIEADGRVVILEANVGYPGIRLHEAMDGPHFRVYGWEQLRRP